MARAARKARNAVVSPSHRAWVIAALAVLVGFALVVLHFAAG